MPSQLGALESATTTPLAFCCVLGFIGCNCSCFSVPFRAAGAVIGANVVLAGVVGVVVVRRAHMCAREPLQRNEGGRYMIYTKHTIYQEYDMSAQGHGRPFAGRGASLIPIDLQWSLAGGLTRMPESLPGRC